MRFLYRTLFYVLLPFIFIRLWWRSRTLPAYRARWGERLGYYPFTLPRSIWVHAVSMGEVLAAVPLIKALRQNHPNIPFLVTTMTPTGSERVQKIFGDQVHHVYLAYDTPGAVHRFLTAMQPVISIIMETELWPTLIDHCYERNIPVCIANARLSLRSAKRYQRVAGLSASMLRQLSLIAAHAKDDAARFIALGAKKEIVHVTGSLKFDLSIPNDLGERAQLEREALGADRFIWIAASTHPHEEEMILAAHKILRAQIPDALLILVPRHPDRFDEVAQLCTREFTTVRRTAQLAQREQNLAVADTDVHTNAHANMNVNTAMHLSDTMSACSSGATAVYLGDTMGELLLLYATSDVTFVGGSLIERGGHNLLEPAALHKPVLSGPHLFNFTEISELLLSANALLITPDVSALANTLIELSQNKIERAGLGEAAYRVVDANRGALAKQIELIEAVIRNKMP